jgi:hypothetical protein
MLPLPVCLLKKSAYIICMNNLFNLARKVEKIIHRWSPPSTGKIPTDSLAINQVEYNLANHTLDIEFHNNRLYRYEEVPWEVFDALVNSDSKGRYFVKNIRNSFRCWRLTEAKKASLA